MNVSIVIPNYNGGKLLEINLPKVIESISDYKNGSIDIIIVDDCSTDNSIQVVRNIIDNKLEKWKDRIKIFKNKKNLGFSSVVNRGVRKAGGEIIILLNTDVVPQGNFLKSLLSHFKDPKVFAIGCLDQSIENKGIILRGRGIGKWQKGFLIHSRGEVDKTNTLWVSGGSGAFSKNIWNKLGGFNTLYNPFYWEDIDLSYRALKSGYKILFDPKSVVVHEHEKGSIKIHYSKSTIKTIAYRNQFIFVWENATDLNLQLLHIIWLPYHFLKALIRLDMSFFLGLLKAFILLPKIIKFSFIAQKGFIKKDREIMEEFLK